MIDGCCIYCLLQEDASTSISPSTYLGRPQRVLQRNRGDETEIIPQIGIP